MLMRLYGLFDDLPLWALLVITAMIASLSFESGFRIGRWRSRRHDHEQEVVVRSEVGAMLGLVTFILAVTFWIATAHFDAARQSLLNQANAIKTAYLRADLLPEPHRTEIRNFLREYVDIRLEAVRSGNINPAIARSEELHDLLWSQAIAAREKASSQILAGYFIQSLNEVISLHTRRMIIREEFRIPDTIWIVVYVIMTLAVLAIGCHAGLTGARRPIVVTAFVLIISVVLTLIADLDSPRRGSLRVSQQAMVNVRRTMNDTNQ
jgi:hypothetical protein